MLVHQLAARLVFELVALAKQEPVEAAVAKERVFQTVVNDGRVVEHEGSVAVLVEDDGRGFDRDAALLEASIQQRFGLTGMSERVEMLGSELQIDSEPGEGTRISFILDAWNPTSTTLHAPSDLSL